MKDSQGAGGFAGAWFFGAVRAVKQLLVTSGCCLTNQHAPSLVGAGRLSGERNLAALHAHPHVPLQADIDTHSTVTHP